MRFPIPLIGHLERYSARIARFLANDFANAGAEKRRELAAEARRTSAWTVAALAPMPLPFADVWTITPVQMTMVRAIGNIYGYKMDANTAKEMLGVVGGGLLGQQLCLALFKIGMPGVGGFTGAAFAFFWTHGLGHAAEAYFKSGKTATADQLAEARRRGMEQAKSEPTQPEESEKDAPA